MGVTKDLKVAAALAKALSHPRRIKILQEAEGGRISPVGFSKTEDLPVSKASYHFGELKKAGCLKMVDTVARRGGRTRLRGDGPGQEAAVAGRSTFVGPRRWWSPTSTRFQPRAAARQPARVDRSAPLTDRLAPQNWHAGRRARGVDGFGSQRDPCRCVARALIHVRSPSTLPTYPPMGGQREGREGPASASTGS